MRNLTRVQKLNCEPWPAFRNVDQKASKSFDIKSCVSTSKEKSNTSYNKRVTRTDNCLVTSHSTIWTVP